jgi:hypothetical protein
VWKRRGEDFCDRPDWGNGQTRVYLSKDSERSYVFIYKRYGAEDLGYQLHRRREK